MLGIRFVSAEQRVVDWCVNCVITIYLQTERPDKSIWLME